MIAGRRTASLVMFVLAVSVAASLLIGQPASAATDGLNTAEQAVLDLVNEERARNGLGPLVATQTLNAAAAWMAVDLSTIDGLDHTDTLGRGLRDRFNAFDYPSNSTIRENIAAGYSTPEAVVEGWINSPGHYANILAEEAQAAGIALFEAPGTTYRYFWVYDFGSVVDSPLPAAANAAPAAQPVQISGVVPSQGVGLMVVQEAASPEQLIVTVQASGCTQAAIWVTSNGALIGFLGGAPAFVNQAFPASLAAGSVFVVSCG